VSVRTVYESEESVGAAVGLKVWSVV
jgi:hypothetical protein